MAAMRRELAEDILKKVNGGFYYDPENRLVGISKDGPLYKFADPDTGELIRNLYLTSYPNGEQPTAEEGQVLDKCMEDLIAQGILIPYQG